MPQILDYLYRILVTGGSGLGKANTVVKLIKQQNDDGRCIIDKFYLSVKGPIEAKHQYHVKKYEKTGLEGHED